MRQLWYKWRLSVWTRRTRQAKARWDAVKNTVKERPGSIYCPWGEAETKYCGAAVEKKYYSMMVGIELLPVAKVVSP